MKINDLHKLIQKNQEVERRTADGREYPEIRSVGERGRPDRRVGRPAQHLPLNLSCLAGVRNVPCAGPDARSSNPRPFASIRGSCRLPAQPALAHRHSSQFPCSYTKSYLERGKPKNLR
jgi:hypothetical protein